TVDTPPDRVAARWSDHSDMPGVASDLGRPFAILHVCIGNICRSVMAERLTRRDVERRMGACAHQILVSSAGTGARPGEPMHPLTAAALRASGLDAGGFAARRLTPELVAASDLVLASTVVERDAVLDMAPSALRRTFTLREFARL